MKPQFDPTARRLLKIAGMIMLVFGVFGTVLYLLGLAGVLALNYATSGVFSVGSDLIGMGLLLLCAVAELTSGVLGLRSAKQPERAGRSLLVWSGLTLLLTLLGMGWIVFRSANLPWWELVLGLLLGVVTPAVYLSAAAKLRNPTVFDGAPQPHSPEP